jgi:protein-disulfide isomerase
MSYFQSQELPLRITRREFCQTTASVTLSLAVLGISSLPPFIGEARAADAIPAAELMKPDKLPDMVMGSDKAPVTVIEYASMTCPHCAHFQETTFPELKKRYIDTGKVRYIFREFPLDSLAAAAFVLARCSANSALGRSKSRCRHCWPSPSKRVSPSKASMPVSRIRRSSKA